MNGPTFEAECVECGAMIIGATTACFASSFGGYLCSKACRDNEEDTIEHLVMLDREMAEEEPHDSP